MKRRAVSRVGLVAGLPASNQQGAVMRTILLTGAALIALSQVTMAQSPNSTSPNAKANNTANDTASSITADQQHMRSNLRNALEKAGYKDIRVAPTSFMVHARDSDGNPVVMAISPDTFSEVADMTNSSGNNSTSSTTGVAGNAGSSGTFVSVTPNDELSSKMIGLDIYNNDNKDIGQIQDIALGPISCRWAVSSGWASTMRYAVGGEGHLQRIRQEMARLDERDS
jgi:hypothetical protein